MVFESFLCSCIYAKFPSNGTESCVQEILDLTRSFFAQYKEHSEQKQFMLAYVERELLARQRAKEHV